MRMESAATSNILDESKSQEQCKINAPAGSTPKRCFGLTVEPVLFLAMFGSNVSGSLITNLLFEKSCVFKNLENCSDINTQSGGENEKILEPYVASLNLYKTIIEALAPTILAFFIGAWSDTYGRRPLMLAPLLGYCLNSIILFFFVWFNMDPMFILLTVTPLVVLGGSMTLFTGLFCYLNDITAKNDVPMRMALAEGFLYLGFLCGNTAGPYLFSIFPSHGYEIVISISFGICLCGLLYVVFLVPESIADANEHDYCKQMRALFDLKQVIDLFRVCFGYHEGYSRPIRLILVLVSLLSLITLEGTLAVSFLYTRARFSWDVKQFALYIDVALICSICGILFGTMVFSKLLKLSSGPLSCFAYFLKAAGYLVAGLGNTGMFMYISSAVGALGGIASPVTRALISDTVPKNDIGKLYSILSAFMTGVPIIAGSTYTLVFNSTIDTFPGAVFLLSASLSVMCSVLLGVVITLQQFYYPQPYTLAVNSNL